MDECPVAVAVAVVVVVAVAVSVVNNQAATKWGQTHWILRLLVWMGSDKDKMWIGWVTIRCKDGGCPVILKEEEVIYQ